MSDSVVDSKYLALLYHSLFYCSTKLKTRANKPFLNLKNTKPSQLCGKYNKLMNDA